MKAGTGSIFIISAPSGTGKTTVLKKVMAEMDNLFFSVSHTTRPQRPGETDDKDYHFVDVEEFKQIREDNGFMEWAEVHGNFYGTGQEQVEAQLENGDVILDIDVQGAKQIKISSVKNCLFIFITPPSMEELSKRLFGRKTESEDVVKLRLANAKEEMQAESMYDYVVVNDNLDQAVALIKAIIIAERCRTRRDPDGIPLAIDSIKR